MPHVHHLCGSMAERGGREGGKERRGDYRKEQAPINIAVSGAALAETNVWGTLLSDECCSSLATVMAEITGGVIHTTTTSPDLIPMSGKIANFNAAEINEQAARRKKPRPGVPTRDHHRSPIT
ncbi:unnamed protein product, partial [Ectocarpus sp. 12 AP-2014]